MILSFLCFAITSLWYHSTRPVSNARGDQKPIAYVERSQDEIHRRPVTRIIWQLIGDGEPVFPGEAIRTSSQGEVRIQFADSPRFIDLEPDSLIVISQSAKKEISLDLVDGGLTVNQGSASPAETQGPALTLKSGESKVDLSKATASLSKSSGSDINLRVLEGKARIEDSAGKTQEVGSGSSGSIGADGKNALASNLEILSPPLDQPFTFDPKSPEPVSFSWKGFPPGTRVSLLVGSSRKKLKSLGESTESKISLPLARGRHFWKLVAQDSTSLKAVAESPVYRLDLVPRIPPVLVSPIANESILKVSSEQKIDFRWIAPNLSQKIVLEVAKDPALNDKVLTQDFSENDHFAGSLPEGEYYVRLKASFGPQGPFMSSPVQKFSFSRQAAPKPASIQWLNPRANEALHFVQEPTVELSWALAKTASEASAIRSWRVKWSESQIELSGLDSQEKETTEPQAQIPFEKSGRYFAQIEGLGPNKEIVAVSEVRDFEVAPLPLLPAPQLLPADGDLNADNKGNLSLKWSPVAGAKEYKVILLDRNGVEKRSATFKKTSTTLVNLLPGEHQVEIQAVDIHGRTSEKPSPRVVRVPASSGLMSPKIRKLKVN